MRIDTQFNRFVLNGVAATIVHYTVLSSLIEIAHLPSVGVANGIASLFGISASYLGNKLFVFCSDQQHTRTLPRFVAVYVLVALLHALVLAVWTDLAGLPYTVGFLIATAGSMILTFFCNRFFVFGAVAVAAEAIN